MLGGEKKLKKLKICHNTGSISEDRKKGVTGMVNIYTKDTILMFNMKSFYQELDLLACIDAHRKGKTGKQVKVTLNKEKEIIIKTDEVTEICFEPRTCSLPVIGEIEKLTEVIK